MNKPFRSPLKNLSQTNGPEYTSPHPAPAPSLHVDSTGPPGSGQQSPAETSQNAEFSTSSTLPTDSPLARRNPAHELAKAPAMTLDSRRLTSSIITTRATVSTLQQALKILEDPDRSEALAALSEKWRGAARLAADAVFASARDKVNQMGGVGAWRENEQERIEWRKGWDDKDWQIETSCTGSEAEEANSDAREDVSENQEGGFWDNVNDDDVCFSTFLVTTRTRLMCAQGFTIGMMLRSMNIDFNSIGYSEELQTWL